MYIQLETSNYLSVQEMEGGTDCSSRLQCLPMTPIMPSSPICARKPLPNTFLMWKLRFYTFARLFRVVWHFCTRILSHISITKATQYVIHVHAMFTIGGNTCARKTWKTPVPVATGFQEFLPWAWPCYLLWEQRSEIAAKADNVEAASSGQALQEVQQHLSDLCHFITTHAAWK